MSGVGNLSLRTYLRIWPFRSPLLLSKMRTSKSDTTVTSTTRCPGELNGSQLQKFDRLTSQIMASFAAHESNPHRMGFITFEDLLTNGAAAGAVVDNRLVALAHTNAMTARYGDIGVFTDEAWRGRGFATSAASIVAHCIRERGRVPVWSAGEDNAASLRVAAKLGFVEASRRVYLNIVVPAA